MSDATKRPRLHVARGGGFAYVPGEVVVQGEAGFGELGRFAGLADDVLADVAQECGGFRRCGGVEDVLVTIEYLRSLGHTAQPNHILFAHGYEANPFGANPFGANPFGANPFGANPFGANPFGANPFGANPFGANPFGANPFGANPLGANPYGANGGGMSRPSGGQKAPRSLVSPASRHELPQRRLPATDTPPVIAVLDTGLPAARPDLLADTKRITGDLDQPDTALVDWEGTTHAADGVLDPYAGHGVFIAGLIEQLAGGCRIHVKRVVGPLGDADEVSVARALRELAKGEGIPGETTPPDIALLSLGAPTLESPFLLRAALADCHAAGVTVVASAGNDGSSLPHYPAASPGVLSVGALGPAGPAIFTNHGPWVDCCAPGVDLVSSFFRDVVGPAADVNTVDVDDFDQWARWSGSSFSAPVVVAALAREMVAVDCDAREAIERIVHAPHLLRLPGLGTVVNI